MGTTTHSNRLPFAALACLALAFVVPGLVGHDPWKQDETYIFSIVQHMLDTRDWLVPYSGGTPFVEKPPLYYWVAALLGRALSPWLPLYDGARLASGLFTGLTLLFTGLAARAWWGPGHGRLAVLALMTCLGLVYETHLMTTDVAHMAGFAMACYGFAVVASRPTLAGVLIGTGVGVSFLGKGLLAPTVVGVTAMLLPLCSSTWRTRRYAAALAVAFLTVLPWIALWPLALYLRSPALFVEWFWENNVGRFLGFSVARLGAVNDGTFWFRTLPWFAFPALPLALLTIWRRRRAVATVVPLQFGATAVAVYLSLLLSSASARGGYALPMLVALALLAAPAVDSLPAVLQRWADAIGRAAALVLVALLWIVWALFEFHGSASPLAWLFRAMPLDFLMPLRPLAVSLAVLATIAWVASWRALARLRERAIVSLAAIIATIWVLVSTLLLPWIDYAKSYRSVFVPLNAYLPRNGAVGGVALDESVTAMLLYYCGLTPALAEEGAGKRLSGLLVQNDGVEGNPFSAPPGWTLAWEGARPGDRREHFRLFLPPGRYAESRFIP